MPLWGHRGHRRGTQSASGDLVARLHATSLDTSAGLSRMYDVSNPNIDADSSDSDEELHPSSKRHHSKRPPHARSISQPFPNPFAATGSSSSGRRRESSGALPTSLDRSGEDGSSSMRRQSALVQQRRSSGVGARDVNAGTCMTCGGMVTWPLGTETFKCTICVTVNDVVPRPSSQRSSESPVLTLEQTKHLARQSVRVYLCRRLLPDPLLHPNHQTQLFPKDDIYSQGSLDKEDRPETTLRGRPDHLGAVPPHLTRDKTPESHRRPVRQDLYSQRKASYTKNERPSLHPLPPDGHSRNSPRNRSGSYGEEAKRIFKPLESYLTTCFSSFDCVNSAFPSRRAQSAAKSGSETIRRKPVPSRDVTAQPQPQPPSEPPRSVSYSFSGGEAMLPELDAKLLLLGDVGENGTWWTGQPAEPTQNRSSVPNASNAQATHGTVHSHAHSNSPQIHWDEVFAWYHAIINAAEDWFAVYEELAKEPGFLQPTEQDLFHMESDLLIAQEHAQRHLLKATEMLLKRPGRPLNHPTDVRFLLIILENPLLHSKVSSFSGLLQHADNTYNWRREQDKPHGSSPTGPLAGQHSNLIKRLLGLLSYSSTECHDALIAWFARSHHSRFSRNKDLISAFMTYRMLRANTRRQENKVDITAGLIPQMQAGRSGAYLHDEIGASRTPKKNSQSDKKFCYSEDWQLKAAARVLALLFSANNVARSRRTDDGATLAHGDPHSVYGREAIHANGQLLATSDFYLSIVDYSADLVADFEAWEAKRGKFAFCQYPFMLSIRAKTEILEHDARRQMQSKARDAFFDSIMSRRAVNQYFSLDVRRDCLVDDSLKAVSEVIGSGSEDVKKALRITFRGEEGIDGGGLRKEWFLMLIREVFNPDHGLFIYDDESQFCYFNPHSFETTDQFFLVGVVIGLAIYNSTILDVALPPFAFRKLLASAPAYGTGTSSHSRHAMKYTLEDLATYRPQLARGLKQLLDFEGDVEASFGMDFAIDIEKYGSTVNVPLCVGGERKPVTNANRREFVDLYVLYMLDTAVKRQFEPFKRGFYTVCGGNAFSLFRPEEIELLVRGSDQPLDIPSLRAVATYDNWGAPNPNETEPIVEWFWHTFERAPPAEQRNLLSFITGSDRIPATGASTLSIRVACLGDDAERFPIARTCFNSISLFRYHTREKLEAMLWRAVHESEGFGLK